jgi:hypothetical protein
MISVLTELQKNINAQIEIVFGSESTRGETNIKKVEEPGKPGNISRFFNSFKKKRVTSDILVNL